MNNSSELSSKISSLKRQFLDACSSGRTEVVKTLISRDRIIVQQEMLRSGLKLAIEGQASETILRLILRHTLDEDFREEMTDLACSLGNTVALQVLLIELTPKLKRKQELFHLASSNNKEATMLLLLQIELQSGKLVDKHIPYSRDFLQRAIDSCFFKLASFLLRYIEDAYLGLLCFLSSQKHSNSEILSWMKEQKGDCFVRSAGRVIESEIELSSELIPIQALMMRMLYPSSTSEDILSDFPQVGVKERVSLQRARALLSVYDREERRIEKRTISEE